MITMPTTAEMQRARKRRDASYDGVFFVAVKTTRIFCRPSCPAKDPHERNVEYYSSVEAATEAGYRACKRCRPMDTQGAEPAWVTRLLDELRQSPTARLTDADLRGRSIDPTRARRYFRTHYGMTFQAYQRARRLGCALIKLNGGADVLEVAFDHGYESSSGFRDAFQRTFGEPAGRGKDADPIVVQLVTSPVGPLLIGAVKEGVCLLEFADRPALRTQLASMRKYLSRPTVPGRNDHLERLTHQLTEYFAGRRKEFDLPLVMPGTPFQRGVWAALRSIPFGTTTCYERLAQDLGRNGAQRAVGRANGANRIAIIVPCHRVVQKDGRLRGYGGGLWRKQFLLDLERGAVERG